jgi:hypothetical protein
LTVALPESLNEATNPQALYANPSPLIMAAIVYLAFFWPIGAHRQPARTETQGGEIAMTPRPGGRSLG